VNVLLVPAHPGFPGQIPQSRKTVVCCVCICTHVNGSYSWLLAFCIGLAVFKFFFLTKAIFNQATGYASQHIWCLSQQDKLGGLCQEGHPA